MKPNPRRTAFGRLEVALAAIDLALGGTRLSAARRQRIRDAATEALTAAATLERELERVEIEEGQRHV